MHYGNALEILVCCDLSGEAVIDSATYPINGNAVFVIPPHVLHSTYIHASAGCEYVLHISLPEMNNYLNIESFLQHSGMNLNDLPHTCPAFDEVLRLVQDLIDADADVFQRTCVLLQIIRILQSNAPKYAAPASNLTKSDANRLETLIAWTLTHYFERITLDDAAHIAGFSKSHFCSWFKRNAKKTYNAYLTDVRISCACGTLVKTGSISAACYDNGFSNMSYFIQVFKSKQKCTPSQYLRNAVPPNCR